jgi:MFS family permease
VTVSDPAQQASASSEPSVPRTVELEVFQGRGLQRVHLNRSAPFGWWALVVLALVSLLDRLEQSVLAGALPEIKEHFGIGNTGAGLIATATGIAGVLLFIPAGRIADKMNRTRGLVFVLVSWSVLSIGSGLAVSFAMLLAMRTLIGAAGQLNNPAGSSLMADYYPGQSRTKAYGIERLVYFLGNPIGVIAGGIIAEKFGWEWVFIGLVLPGFVVAGFCWFLKEPVRGVSDRIDAIRAGRPDIAETVAETTQDEVKSSPWDDVRLLLKVPTLRALYISQGILYFGLGGLFFFTPTFLHEQFDLAEGAAAGISGSIGLVGVAVGATIGIKIGSKYHGIRPGWRIRTGAVGLAVGTVGVATLAAATVLPVAALGFLVVNIGFMIAIPNFAAGVADLTSSVRRGMSFSVMQLVIGLASAMGPLMIGALADWFGFNGAYGVMVIPLAVAVYLSYQARTGYDRDVAAAGLVVVGSPTT